VISAQCRLVNELTELKNLVLEEPPVKGGLSVRVLR